MRNDKEFLRDLIVDPPMEAAEPESGVPQNAVLERIAVKYVPITHTFISLFIKYRYKT